MRKVTQVGVKSCYQKRNQEQVTQWSNTRILGAERAVNVQLTYTVPTDEFGHNPSREGEKISENTS